jgi:hypothetical protein
MPNDLYPLVPLVQKAHDYHQCSQESLASESAVKIITQHMSIPVPDTNCNWVAVFDNWEFGDCMGYGKTEDEAIVDLMEKQFKGELQ